MDNDKKLLAVPVDESVRYKTNFIKTAVCELRFPTLLELENTPPIKFQTALRKQYPYYSEEHGLSIGLGSSSAGGKRYLFESKKRDWTISLKSSSISLETNKYTDFEDFYERFDLMLKAIGNLLDTDFFTRVGLRYINSVPLPSNNMDRSDIDKWINPVLVAPLKGDELGSLKTFHCEISGSVEDGGYTFRHGFAPPNNQDRDALSYMLDYDYFKDGVEYDDVLAIIKKFNVQNFSFFKWSLGNKSIEALGEGKNK
ncbi:MAG: TIGR04255 family protein [Gammaproteobacteria bacterium]|nr:TIGR04255 family protein [Gammaproteobacteria bacterium]